jgi:enoyl-[acyl-carrier protein] reductase II
MMTDGNRGRVCALLGIQWPILQAGMVWVSGARLAAACSEAGILGVIGAGSMTPDLLKAHIIKAQALTAKPFAINMPILYSRVEEQITVALDAGVRIFITSAGSPKTHTQRLKDAGCVVIHVVSTPALAEKCEAAGVDAVVAEGFEAGGHNGRDELTTLTLIPQVLQAVSIPVIAAGGIATGAGIAAMMALGAHGVQMGTRFLATVESSAHPHFKKAVLQAQATDTALCMKSLVPVRLLKNKFYQQVAQREGLGGETLREDLQAILGKGRARLGMLDGDMDAGELEVGQISGVINDLPLVADLVPRLIQEYNSSIAKL